MTTIILTIIGILLAAAAALMVIFYGGDAFNSGSIGAQANTYQNAGTNVIAAVQLAKADAYAYSDIGSLTTNKDVVGTGTHDPYLKTGVALPNGAVGTLSANTYTVPLSGADAVQVCTRINKNLKLSATPTSATASTFKMGCYDSTFFANA